MKKIIILILFLGYISCKENLSKETKNLIAKKESFWKNRNEIINKNKNKMEYPIKKDTTITEQKPIEFTWIIWNVNLKFL